jgi:hypothetical protein
MIALVSFGEVVKVLLAGATFLPLAYALAWGLARAGITARDARGDLRPGPCVWIALSCGALVFVHALALWSFAPGTIHPVLNVFYFAGSLIAWSATTRARTPKHAEATSTRAGGDGRE